MEVSEYVLPKFEVTLESPNNFSFDDENVHAVLRAKYTHGKPLRGTAVVSIEEDRFYGFRRFQRSAIDQALVKKTILLDGRETIEFDIANELKCDRNDEKQYYVQKTFKITAEVTETLTGISQSAEKIITVHKDAYVIKVDVNYAGIIRGSTLPVKVSVFISRIDQQI